jgi:hypothetical protein
MKPKISQANAEKMLKELQRIDREIDMMLDTEEMFVSDAVRQRLEAMQSAIYRATKWSR